MEPACDASSHSLGNITLEAAGKKREPLAIKALSIVGTLSWSLQERVWIRQQKVQSNRLEIAERFFKNENGNPDKPF